MIPERTTEHVPIVNTTPFVAWTVQGAVRPPTRSLTLIVKATWSLPEMALDSEQRLPSGDVRDGDEEDLGAPLLYASDFAPFKPRADVTASGYGYPAPGVGTAGLVELSVGRPPGGVHARVALFGPRRWSVLGAQSEPSPFERVALSRRLAFGGAGLGPGALPQLEDPDHLVTSPADRREPASLTPLSAEEPARRRLLGTYDRAWLKERWPFFPADFDWRYFNAAPPGLQCDYLRGDEPFRLAGLAPRGAVIAGRLPGRVVSAFAQQATRAGGRLVPLSMHLDTVHFDTSGGDTSRGDVAEGVSGRMELVMLWRGVLELGDVDGSEIATLLVLDHDVGEAPTSERAAAALFAALEREELERMGSDEPPGDDAGSEDEPAETLPQAVLVSREDVLVALSSGVGLASASEGAAAEPGEIDWAGADLSGLDLSGRDLSGAILSGADLGGSSLRGCRLCGALMDGVVARAADLSGAVLAGANLSGAVLDEADLSGADLRDADLGRASLAGAVCCDIEAADATWAECRATGARFDGALLSGGDFSGAEIARASFAAARLEDVMLYDCRAEGACFDRASLDDLRADGADLRGASLSEARGSGASFESATLVGARLGGAVLPDGNFARARLEEADLSGADLRRACFRKAHLGAADLRGSNLMAADFQDADLRGADLRGSSLYRAETWGAALDDALVDGALLAGTKLSRGQEGRGSR